jgi:probable HAF family extracellular repeat protein
VGGGREEKMNFAAYAHVAGVSALVLLATGLLAARAQPAAVDIPGTHHHFRMIDLGTLGGPSSSVSTEPEQSVIDDAGTIVGGSETSVLTPEPGCYNPIGNNDCLIIHAFSWEAGHLKDLGTLPGGNYSYALEINATGQIVGVSETNQFDPAAGNPEFHAVLWENHEIHDLGTLGGTASFAEVLNNRGQVIGNSLNDVFDPLSVLGSGGNLTLTQTHGFIWQGGKMHDLGTLGGPDSWASFVNERGQVAGASYTSDVVNPNTGVPQIDLFLWEDGKMKDLGNLGGSGLSFLNSTFGALPWIVTGINDRGEISGGMTLAGDQVVDAFLWNGSQLLDLGSLGGHGSYASGINNRGEVAGVAVLPGDQTNDGFLWRDGAMIDLGTVGDDPCSAALALNSKAQVIGASESAAGGCAEWTTAFLWENGGPMVDLNVLVSSGPEVHLTVGIAISERGEIVAAGAPPGCDVLNAGVCQHIYALVPCDEGHPGMEDCDYSLVVPDSSLFTPSIKTNQASTRKVAKPSPSEVRNRLLSVMRRGPTRIHPSDP